MRRVLLALVFLVCGSAAQADLIISDGGLEVDVNSGNGAIASVKFGGIEYYRRGDFVSNYGFMLGTDPETHVTATAGGFSTLTASAMIVGGTVEVTGFIDTDGLLAFTRTYSVIGGDTLFVSTTFSNLTADAVEIRAYDTFDPDQGVDLVSDFRTVNDIDGSGVAHSIAGAFSVDLFGDGITTFTPGALGIFSGDQLLDLLAAPYDPDGAFEDIGSAIMYVLSLDADTSVTYTHTQKFAGDFAPVPEPASLAVFGLMIPMGAYVAKRRRNRIAA